MGETVMLPCVLTEAEIADRAAMMARLVLDEQVLETKKKIAMDGFKEELDHVAGDIRRLAQAVRDRSERRQVEISYHHDVDRYVVATIRQDTGEIVTTRPMTAEEMADAKQGKLPGIGRRSKS